MKIDRTRNTIRNFIWGMINRVVQIVLPFICRTLLINYIGSDFLGLDGLFTSILQMLNITELGFSSAIVFSMYKPIAENDEGKVCALLNLYRKVYRIIGTCILIVGLFLIPWLPNLIKGSAPEGANLTILYLFFLGNTVLGYWLYAYKSALLNAYQRVDIISNINTIITILKMVVQIVVIYVFKNYYLYLTVMLASTILQNIFVKYQTERLFPQYICRGTLDVSAKADIIKRIKGLMFQKVCVTSRNSMDNIIISMFIGLKSVTLYGNYYTIMVGIQGFLGCITSAMAGGIGNGIAMDSIEENHDKLELFNFMYMWIAGFASICLLCLYQPVMLLWLGKEYLLDNYIMILICIYFYSSSMGAICTLYTAGAGLWWEGRYRSALEAGMNIILNIVLGYFYGIAGVIMATIISILLINFGYGSTIMYKFYFKNGKLLDYYMKHLRYALTTTIVGVVVYKICSLVAMSSIVGLFVRLIICVIVSNILYLLIYFKNTEFRNAISFAKNLRHSN